MKNVTLLAVCLGLAAAAAAIGQVLETPLTSMQYSASRLTADQSTAVGMFRTDQITTVTVRVVSSSQMRTTILSPNQQTITPENIDTFAGTYASIDGTGSSGPVPVPGLNLSGYLQLYTFPAPALGEYQLQHQAVAPVPAEVAVLAMAEVASSLRSGLVLSSQRVPVGSAVAVGVALFQETAPLTGASIQSSLTGPDGVPQPFTFVDNGESPDHTAGDGLHSARFVPSVAGQYVVSATASGLLGPGQPYRRHMAARVEVMPRDIYFASNAVTVTPVDADSNGRLDRLDITTQVRADRAARFYLDVIWNGPTPQSGGAEIMHQEVTVAGTFPVTVQIPASELLESENIGVPFQAERVRLYQFTGDESWLNDEVSTNLPAIGPFTPIQLERPPIWIRSIEVAPFSANGQPPFESLRGTVKIYVTQSGTYQWDVEIGPQCWPRYFKQQFSFSLSAAVENTVNIQFDGALIGQSGFDGPFNLDELDIYMLGASYSREFGLIGEFANVPNSQWPGHTPHDCNNNGIHDRCDLRRGALDCNANGLPDECDPDCDFDAIPDACDPPDIGLFVDLLGQ